MRFLFLNSVSFLFMILGLNVLVAQESIVDKLIEEGFENIQFKHTETDTYLAYENNRYRFEANALYVVLEHLSQSPVTDNIHVVIKNKDIPYTALHTSKSALILLFKGVISLDEWLERSSITLEVDALRKELKDTKAINSSFYKLDIPVGISLNYQLGNFDNPIRLKYKLQPELYTTLARGAYLTGLYNVPFLFNDFDNYNESRFISMHASKDIRLPYNTFVNLNAGYFFYNRYGVYIDAFKFFNEEKFKLSFEYKHTQRGVITPDFNFSHYGNYYDIILGGITYRNQKHDSELELKYGQFNLGDMGYNFSFLRQINEVYIGLFLRKSDLGNLVGFRFVTPLGFKKHLKPTRVRVRTREYFKLKYNYNGTTPAAYTYDFGEKLFWEIKEYYPSTLKRGLERMFYPEERIGDIIKGLFE